MGLELTTPWPGVPSFSHGASEVPLNISSWLIHFTLWQMRISLCHAHPLLSRPLPYNCNLFWLKSLSVFTVGPSNTLCFHFLLVCYLFFFLDLICLSFACFFEPNSNSPNTLWQPWRSSAWEANAMRLAISKMFFILSSHLIDSSAEYRILGWTKFYSKYWKKKSSTFF